MLEPRLWRSVWRGLIFGGLAADLVLIGRKRGGTFSGSLAVDVFHTHTPAGRRAWLGVAAWFVWHIGWGRFVETPVR